MEGLDFVRELGRRTSQATGDPRETSYLLQRISMAVQLGNVASFSGSLPVRADGMMRTSFGSSRLFLTFHFAFTYPLHNIPTKSTCHIIKFLIIIKILKFKKIK